MDASTSTAGDANNNYYCDVFVNHRGPDVKKTFASHLYRRLIREGLRVFLDYEELQVGEKLTPQIEKAIETASVHVAIFSPGYARSSWCLNELLHMLKSEAPIVPVFHHVEPADLRWTQPQGRRYAQALFDLEKKTTEDGQLRYSSTIIEEWRNALLSVADTSGLELKAFNEDEGLLLDKVIECVLRKVKKTQLNVAKHPTGLDEKAQHFEEIVLSKQHSGRVRVVGIAGMGGVGKTTLAKELFNRKSSNHRNSCFLFDVRENAKRSLPSLQRKLLKGLFQLDKPIDNAAEGIETLRKHLKEKPVLIVLDDVDNVRQVDYLLPMDVLQPDSLILITSRHMNVLLESGVQKLAIYQLTGLDEYHSKELFCSYAFCKPCPPSEFVFLVHKFLEACKGLPLSLKVLGALVYGRDPPFWEMKLKELRKTLHQEIKESLQISYDALEENQKQVFLDIACFFIGEEKDMAIKIWDGSGWSGSLEFQALQEKCLVEVDFGNRISMHDNLRDLGRHLAKDPTLPCRLWRGKEDIDDLKQHSDGKANVRGISFRKSEEDEYGDEEEDGQDDEEDEYGDEEEDGQDEEYDSEEEEDGDEHDDADSLFQLTEAVKVAKLQLLDVDILSQNFMRGLDSPNLVWLRWCACHLSSLPPWVPMENLRVLEVDGEELKTLWDDKSKVPLQLRELRIFAPLSKIPESIGKLRRLERIEIRCPYSTYQHFQELPKTFGRLRLLKALVLDGCSKMRFLPDSLGKLTNLEHIRLFACEDLERLPNSFGGLSKLRTVEVAGCPELEELPDFENLSSLEELHVSSCAKLKSIRGSAELKKLRTLKVSYCHELEELPDFENLSSLEELEVIGCMKLKSKGGLQAELKKLRTLNVSDCPELVELPDFENSSSLEELHVSFCAKLKSIRGSAELKKLRTLKVSYCRELEELPDFENLRSLEELHVSGCAQLKSKGGLQAELTKLRTVIFHHCYVLQELLSFENSSSLQKLCVSECYKLKGISVSTEVPKLRTLNVADCWELEELPSFENLRSLEELRVTGCPKLKSIPGLPHLTELRLICCIHCHELEELPDVEHLRSLTTLVILGCPKLQLDGGVVEQLRKRLTRLVA